MIYLLHFVVIAASMDIDGNRVPKGSQFSIRSDDPRASAWEKSPRMKLTGRELIGSADPAASAASHAHRLIDALALAVGEFSRAVQALPDAEAKALGAIWPDRSPDDISRPFGDALASLLQRGFMVADKFGHLSAPSDDAPEASSEPRVAPGEDLPPGVFEIPFSEVPPDAEILESFNFDEFDRLIPAPVADEIPAPAPAGDGWDAIDDDFAAVAGPDRAALAALVADDEATLKAMHAAIEGSAIEVATTKRAQREAIAAWLAANPG